MKLLGIDTCGLEPGVALAEGTEVLAEERLPAGSRASQELLPAIERLLRSASLGLEEVEGFAAVRGPGSFTGLRVGLATASGLALATGRPAAGFSALDLLSEQAPGSAPSVWAVLDAGRGEFYAAHYRRAGRRLERSGEYRLLSAAAVIAVVGAEAKVAGEQAGAEASAGAGGTVLLGGGAEALRSMFERSVPEARVVPHRAWLAGDAAGSLARTLAAGGRPAPGSLRPLYIRPSEAERTARWRTTSSASTA